MNMIGAILGQGRYRIDQEIGHGGQGMVYKGRHLVLDVPIAIKILSVVDAQDPVTRMRFEREAKRAAQLKHPNIVTVYDSGYENGVYYIVSEFIEGSDLRGLLAQQNGSLSVEQALGYIDQVGAALQYAHDQGVVHRDVKPANVLIEARTNRAVLCDFGLARMVEGEDITATHEQHALGTPAYMSPEQCMGRAIDHRSDLYSFGLMVYEMLVGRHPFRGEHDTSDSVRYKQVHEMPPAPRALNPAIKPAIEKVLAGALAKDPKNRLASVNAFTQALHSAYENQARSIKPAYLIGGGVLVIAVVAILFLARKPSASSAQTPLPAPPTVLSVAIAPPTTATAAPVATDKAPTATAVVVSTEGQELTLVSPAHNEVINDRFASLSWLGPDLRAEEMYAVALTAPSGQSRLTTTTQRSLQTELNEFGVYTWSVQVVRIKDKTPQPVGQAAAEETFMRPATPTPSATATATPAPTAEATATPKATAAPAPTQAPQQAAGTTVTVMIQGGEGDWLKDCRLVLFKGTHYDANLDTPVRAVSLNDVPSWQVSLSTAEADWVRFEGDAQGDFWKKWTAGAQDPNVIKLSGSQVKLEFKRVASGGGGGGKGPTMPPKW